MKGTFLPRLPLSYLEIATTPRLTASLPQPKCLLAPLRAANVTVLTLALGLMNVAGSLYASFSGETARCNRHSSRPTFSSTRVQVRPRLHSLMLRRRRHKAKSAHLRLHLMHVYKHFSALLLDNSVLEFFLWNRLYPTKVVPF